ncbi:TolC family protein [uncultured Bacteroides sp.]|uniref:TolC family protein n=1 Tax=uncultured Bacteroides sp. TaxID=162156 RepID=UPI00280B94E9|nr:TolC family protein [uncultured Bacteroides sp.]
MKKKIITLWIAVGVIPLGSMAQESWTLRQCIDYAISHNISVKQSENAAEQSNVDVSTAKWARLPNLNAGAEQSFNWGRTSRPVQDTVTKVYSSVYENVSSRGTNFSLSTNVPLFTGFSIPNQYALAKLNLKAATADLEKAKEDLAVNVASAYVQVLYNQELSKVAEEQVLLSKEQLSRIEKMNEVGKASPAEFAEARSRVAQDQMSAVQAKNNYQLSLLELTQLLELSTMEGFSIAAPDVQPTFEVLTPPDEIFLTAASNKPSVMAAQYRLEGSKNNIKIAQSGYYPKLSLNGSLGTNYYSTITSSFSKQMEDNFSKYIGLSLNIPLFDRFETRNRVRAAKLQQQNYSLQLDNVKKGLYKEIQQAWYNALAAESKYQSSDVAVSANEEAFKLMTQKFENGKATAIEFNESKLNLMKSVSDRIQAKYEYMFRTKILDFYKGKPIE